MMAATILRAARVAALAIFPLAAAAASGITAEEYGRVFPQEPTGLHARPCGEAVLLLWSAPPLPGPSTKLAYDPAVDHYRIYRVGPGTDRTLVGEARGTFYELAPPARAAGDYAVTAVVRSGLESGMSHTVAVRAP